MKIVTGHSLMVKNQSTTFEITICRDFITRSFPDRERPFLCDQFMFSPLILSQNRPLRGRSRTLKAKIN